MIWQKWLMSFTKKAGRIGRDVENWLEAEKIVMELQR
jgi:hypothetical protein